MHTMYEALARERMREEQHRSQQAAVASSLARQRRWHRVSVRAQAAQTRHAQRLRELRTH